MREALKDAAAIAAMALLIFFAAVVLPAMRAAP